MRELFEEGAGTGPRRQEHAEREGASAPQTGAARQRHVARAELVLARNSRHPLRTVPLKPDPLQGLAAAVADVRPDLQEHVQVCLDLLPLTPAKTAHLRRTALKALNPPATPATGGRLLGPLLAGTANLALELADEFLPGTGPRGTPAAPSPTPDPGQDRQRRLEGLKFTDTSEPVFCAQLLIRVESQIPGRAQAHLHQLLAAFDIFRGDNYWKSAGWNLGFVHIGSDWWPWRRSFDRRVATGEFRPRRPNLVTAREIAGLLKPPTRHCAHLNVVRSGGLVPAPPRELPLYTGQEEVLPIGYATGPDGQDRLVGTPLEDLFFSFRIGRSRFGKTETALTQAVALALAGKGVWFLDPHADGWRRAAPLLTRPDVLARLWEVDLTVRGDTARIAGYNPLSMAGLGREHIEDRADAVVTAVASALSWSDQASRARTILTKACESLCHLALRLPPHTAPTLFQIPTLLTDTEWRETALGALPPQLRRYWRTTFPRYPADATPTITNIIDRLRSSQTLSAFFGSPVSTYDVRTAMDGGHVVFVCTPPGDIGRLVACFVIFDLFRAGRSRVDVPPRHRRRFDAFVDEVTAIDGASKGHLAAILEQLAKYGVRLHAMTQMAQRLTAATRDALLQNQSMLSSTAGEVDAVRVVAKQWARHVHPDTLVDLPRYTHIVSTTVQGQITTPFRVRGPVVDELFAQHLHPERLDLQRKAIDANLRRRRIRDVLADLDTLDERIRDTLLAAQGGPAPGNGPHPAGTRRAARTDNTGDVIERAQEAAPPKPPHSAGTREGWA